MSTDKKTRRNIKKKLQTLYVYEINSILDEDISDEVRQNKILMVNISFKNSDNPNDYDKEAIKNFVYHFNLYQYENPTFEGIPDILIKIYNNYNKQQEQEQIKINETAFNVVY